jgi:hypothetical protein
MAENINTTSQVQPNDSIVRLNNKQFKKVTDSNGATRYFQYDNGWKDKTSEVEAEMSGRQMAQVQREPAPKANQSELNYENLRYGQPDKNGVEYGYGQQNDKPIAMRQKQKDGTYKYWSYDIYKQQTNENKIQLSESDIKLMCEMVVKKLADKLKSK